MRIRDELRALRYTMNNILVGLYDVQLRLDNIKPIKMEYELTDYKEINGKEYKDLINVYEGRLNNIGDDKYSLSKSWYIKADKKELMKQLKQQ